MNLQKPGDGFDGYNTIGISFESQLKPFYAGSPYWYIYNKNGPASFDPDSHGRELVYPPKTFDTIQIQRKVYVPTNAAFCRWLNIFKNVGSTPKTFTLLVNGDLGSDSNTRITATSTGDKYAQIADRWITSMEDYDGNHTSYDPRLAHVFWGNGAPIKTSYIHFHEWEEEVYWTYNITLGRGQTAIIMNFASGQTSVAKSISAAKALSLPSQKARQYMSASEISKVRNFKMS